jgi:hypothetical protein
MNTETNFFKNLLSITSILILLLNFNLNVFSALPAACRDIEKNPNANPADIAACGSPDDIKTKVSSGTSLYDVIMTINNALLIIVTFFSIIGTIVGVINLAKSQSNKTAYEEARGTITNSILAFLIAVSIWIIVKLIFNTLGIGDLSPTPI